MNLDKPFPFFLNDDKENFLLIAGISAFIYAFVKLFKPFGALANTLNEVHIYSGITLFVLSFNIILLPRLFPGFLDNSNWTLRKYIVFNIYNMVSITLLITLSHYFTRERADILPFHLAFINDLWRTAAIGIMPLVAMTFLLENRLLNATIEAGRAATRQLEQLHHQRTATISATKERIVIRPDFSEHLELREEEFLFARAENNYCMLFLDRGGTTASELVRLFISELQEQIGSDRILRCHRSYMANLGRVESVSGNANGYRLYFSGTDKGIPVSRAMGREVLERIRMLSEHSGTST